MLMKNFVFRYLLFFLFFVGLVSYLTWLDTPSWRYQSYPDHFNMIYKQEGNVDLVALGGSGTYTWFNPIALSSSIFNKTGKRLIIYNFGKNWRGTGIKYLMFRDLIERRPVKNVMIRWRWNGSRHHEHFYQVAKFGDIFESSFAKADYPVILRFWDAFQQSVKKISWKTSILLSGKYKKLDEKKIEPASSSGRTSADSNVPSILKREVESNCQDWETKKDREWDISDIKESRNQHYYQKIIEIARKTKTQVFFHEFPFICRTPLSSEFVRYVEMTFGVEMLIMNRAQLNRLYPLGYSDHGHANEFGQKIYTKWLSAILSQQNGF